MNDKITYIAGGGGAPACYVHMGIAKHLIGEGKTITEQVGTSAGSIVGAYIACKQLKNGKCTTEDIDALAEKEFKGFKDYNILGLAEFYIRKFITGKTPINKVGLFKGEVLHQTICDITENIKFSELPENGMKLHITSTEILTGNLIVFSKETTPNVKIADAVRASCGIQGAFAPFGVELKDVYDNGIYLNNSIKQPYTDVNEDNFNVNEILDMYFVPDNTKIFLVDGGNNGNCRTDIGANIKDDDSDMLAVSFTYNGKAEPITQSRQLIGQSICIMMQATENLAIKFTELKNPNVIVVRPDTLGVGTMDFEVPLIVKKELMESGVNVIKKF